jgi:tetratricopeptide (TPR) repeat protein
VLGRLARLFGKGAAIRTRDATGNFAIGVEGNVTQVFVQASSGLFGANPSDPQLPFMALDNAIVDGKPDISRLLRWNYELVRTLHGRADDVRAIIEWAGSDDPQILLRFVEGEGGAGKTRLAAEVARTLRKHGWAAGFLGRAGAIIHAPSARGLFLIIDYPEEQPQRIDALIGAIRDNRQPGYKIRFLMLSRRSFDAWREAIAPIRDLCGPHPIAHLGPLPAAEAHALVEEAVAHLCGLLGRAMRPDLAGLGAWLESDESHRLSLYATAAAIHLVLIPTQTFDLSAPAILSELVEREMQRIRDASEAAGLGQEALSRLLALAALTGNISVNGLRRLADPILEITQCPATQIVDRIKELPWWDDERHCLPCLTPDLLAAAFSASVFDDRPDIVPNWFYPAMEDRVDAEFVGSLGRVIYDMDRLRLAGPSPVPDWLEEMIDRDPDKAAVFRTLTFEQNLPHRLAGFAAKVGLALAATETVLTDDAALAMMLNNASVDLVGAGRHPDAFAAARRALQIQERLAAADPARFEPILAIILNTWGNRLDDAGDREAALAVTQRAVEIRERLAVHDPARFEPELAKSLTNLAVRLATAGDEGGALAVARRAVEKYQNLATRNPMRFESEFATSLNNLTTLLGASQHGVEALAAGHQVAEIYGRLASGDAARFEPDLAMSLNNLAIQLGATGNRTTALTVIQRAVNIRERLAAGNPVRFEPDLARSLNVLALLQNENGAGEPAAETISYALTLWRRVVATSPARYRGGYIAALHFAGPVFRAAGRDSEAQAVEAELVKLPRS